MLFLIKWCNDNPDILCHTYAGILLHFQPNWSLITSTCNVFKVYTDMEDSWVDLNKLIKYFGDNSRKIANKTGAGAWNDMNQVGRWKFSTSATEFWKVQGRMPFHQCSSLSHFSCGKVSYQSKYNTYDSFQLTIHGYSLNQFEITAAAYKRCPWHWHKYVLFFSVDYWWLWFELPAAAYRDVPVVSAGWSSVCVGEPSHNTSGLTGHPPQPPRNKHQSRQPGSDGSTENYCKCVHSVFHTKIQSTCTCCMYFAFNLSLKVYMYMSASTQYSSDVISL